MSWNEFRQQFGGRGLNSTQISQLYQQMGGGACSRQMGGGACSRQMGGWWEAQPLEQAPETNLRPKKTKPGHVWVTYHWHNGDVEEMEVKEDVPFSLADTLEKEVARSTKKATKKGVLDVGKFELYLCQNYLGYESNKVDRAKLRKGLESEIPKMSVRGHPEMTEALEARRQDAINKVLSVIESIPAAP